MKSLFLRVACWSLVLAEAGCGPRGHGPGASAMSSTGDGGLLAPRSDEEAGGSGQNAGATPTTPSGMDSSAGPASGPDSSSGGSSSDSGSSGGATLDAVTPNDASTLAQSEAATTPALDDSQTLVPDPSWTCGMPNGIPPLQGGQLVFEADLTLGNVYDVGQTQYGQRTLIEIKGGTLNGPQINAEFMDFGLDWQLTLANGVVEDEQVDVLTTNDGNNIFFRSCGTSPGPAGSVRIVPDFEAPSGGAYAWLNTGVFAGTREFDPVAKTLKITVYDVSGVASGNNSVSITDPPGVPNQTWDCKVASGTETSVVYTETVGIAGTITVGASKRGTRIAIPITGGTTSGKIQGTILAGGADFPLMTNSFVIDARYTLQTMEGDLIIVRNCGPLGSLVPVFETRTDDSYAWVNDNHWLSSDPSVGAGVVNLTIYDTQ